MSLAISAQALEFCYAALLGVLCGVGYDILRLLRKQNRRHAALCLFLDACYGLVTCILLIAFVLTLANGQMRWYILFGVFLGGMLYASILSKSVSRVLWVFATALSKLFGVFERVLYRVLRAFYRGLLRISRWMRGRKGETQWRKRKNASDSSRV